MPPWVTSVVAQKLRGRKLPCSFRPMRQALVPTKSPIHKARVPLEYFIAKDGEVGTRVQACLPSLHLNNLTVPNNSFGSHGKSNH